MTLREAEALDRALKKPTLSANTGVPAVDRRIGALGNFPQSAGGKRGRGGSGSSASEGVAAVGPLYVYALGRVEPRFPSLTLEKEFARVIGRAFAAGLTDRQALLGVMDRRRIRELACQLCWVFTIEGMETYLLVPREHADVDLLMQAVRLSPRATDVDLVIGVHGPIPPPWMCNGLMVPILVFDQLYSFDVDALIKAMPRAEKVQDREFELAAEELFGRMIRTADNAGATDEHRALNYLATRYPAIYAVAADAFGRNESLTAVEVRLFPFSGVRKIVDVIFSFTNRSTDVTQKFSVRVDVTQEFPFLVATLSPYVDR
jgi:PatG C-terminal